MLESMFSQSQLFFLAFARILALFETAPLLSAEAIPQPAKIGFALFVTSAVMPLMVQLGYSIPQNAGAYIMLLAGEVLIGIIMGFFLNLVYSAFSMAGELFSLQLGFGASEVFDPLAQVEIPLIGQFMNTIAMLVFIFIGGFQNIFLTGVLRSFSVLKAIDLVQKKDMIFPVFIKSLAQLFEQALILSLPILGTLFLVSIGMGLLSKAAPQMNLLLMGFPVSIVVAFFVMFLIMPFLCEAFASIINGSFDYLLHFLGRKTA
jgi:flagellar biosynthetic protein FliR